MSKIGIKKVAEAAGVSIGTVSKIFNPDSASNISVSEATRKKVLAAAERLDYRPSYGAKLLRGHSTRTIGFAISLPGDSEHSYLSNYTMRLLNGIGDAASRHGFQVLLVHGEDYRHYIDEKRIDALVMTGFRLNSNPKDREMRDMFQRFNERRYPYVVINSHVPGLEHNHIGIDNAAGMALVADLIRRQRYESVGFIGDVRASIQHHHTERAALLSAAGIAVAPERTLIGDSLCRAGNAYGSSEGEAAIEYFLRQNNLPRCLVCGNDVIAHGVMHAARKRGISIPGQLAIIGFDDDENSSYSNPSLTTVRQPLEEFGAAAVEFLLEKQRNSDATITEIRKPILIERESA